MDNRAIVERIMNNLAFEVETIPEHKTIQGSSTSSKLDPLNVKIKVRKKEMIEQSDRGFISHNQSEPVMVPQKVRVVNIDETIISFDMFMEADYKKISRKPRKRIFDRFKPGICLGATSDEDNEPYMPDFKHSIVSQDNQLSKSDGKLGKKFMLSKNSYETFHSQPTKKTERTFLGRKCKPGGCLDPPFDEDMYSYEHRIHPDPSNADIIKHQEDRPMNLILDDRNNKRKSKDTSISINYVSDKVQKSDSIPNFLNIEPIENSVRTYPLEDNNKDIYLYKPIAEASLLHDSNTAYSANNHEDKSMNLRLDTIAPIKSKRNSKNTSLINNSVNDNIDPTRNAAITNTPEDKNKEIDSYKPVAETPLLHSSKTAYIADDREDKGMNLKLDTIAPIKSKRNSKNTSLIINSDNDNTDPIRNAANTNMPKNKNMDIFSHKPVPEAPLLHNSETAYMADHREDKSINLKLDAIAPIKSKKNSKNTSLIAINSDSDNMDPIRNNKPDNENKHIYTYKPVAEALLLHNSETADIADHREDKSMNLKLNAIAPIKSKGNSKNTSLIINSDNDNIDPIRNVPITNTLENNTKDIYSPKSGLETLVLRESHNTAVTDFRQDKQRNSKLSNRDDIRTARKSKDTTFFINPVIDNRDNITNSIIKYPPVNKEEMKNESVNAFFSPPKGIKRDSNNQVQRNQPKRHSYNLKPIKDKPVNYLPVSTSASLISIPIEQNSASGVVVNINPKENSKIKQLIQIAPSLKSTEYKSNHSGEIPFLVTKEFFGGNVGEDEIDASILIGDTKKTSEAMINEKIRYANIDNEAGLGNSNDQILPREYPKAPNENATQPEQNRDANQNKNITDKEHLKTFDTVKSLTDQTFDKTKTILTDYKIPMGIKSKNKEEQSIIVKTEIAIQSQSDNRDTQSLKIRDIKNVSNTMFQHFNLDDKMKNETIVKDIIEILSISDQNPKFERNLSETFEYNEHVNVKNIESKIIDVSNDGEYTLNKKPSQPQPYVTYPGEASYQTCEQQPKDEEKQSTNYIQTQEIGQELPHKQISVLEVYADDTSIQKLEMVEAILNKHENDMRVNDKGLSDGLTAPSIDTNRMEHKAIAPIKLKDKEITNSQTSDSVVTCDLKSVSFNLAFHSYLNNKNERIFKSIHNENEVHRYPNDSITVMKSRIKVSSEDNLPEFNIPIDSLFNMTIKIKANDHKQRTKCKSGTVPNKIKTKFIPTFPQNENSIPERKKIEQGVRTHQDQNDTVLHRILTDIYEQELVPLQTMIRTLKAEIDYMAEQQTILKKKVICSKKSLQRNKRISYHMS